MTVRVNKSSFNIREKLSELGRKFGLKGSELAAAETVQEARDVVSAGRKNIIINGAMQVWQRGTSVTGLTDGNGSTYLADRWLWGEGGSPSSVVTMTRETDVPAGQGFAYSLKVSPTTADSSIDANEIQEFIQHIEAQNLQQLCYGTSNAKVSTLSFWVKCSQTGIANVWCYREDSTRSCTLQYTIDQADTWQKIILTVPADTTGTIPNDTGSGMRFDFIFAAGSNFTGTGGNDGFWGANTGTGRANSQTINYLKTTSDYFQMTGVQYELGKNATDFEHRSYGEELALCQRYYGRIRLANQEWIYNESSTSNHKWHWVNIPFTMRANPTIDASDLTMGISVSGLSGTVTSYVTQRPGDTPGRISSRVGMTVSSGDARAIYHADGWNGDYIAVDAEL